MNETKVKKEKKHLSNTWYLLLIVFAMAVIPLIVYGYVYDSELASASWYSIQSTVIDLFNFYKAQAIKIIGCAMLCFLLCHRIFDKKKFRLHMAFIPLAIYGILVILSMLFSEYSYFSLHGLDEQFETVYVLLSYMIMTFFCYNFINGEKDVKFIFKACGISIALLCITGIFQLFYKDLLHFDFIQHFLFLGVSNDYTLKSMNDGQVYMTLYNPNYVGTFGVLFIPMLTILSVFLKNKIGKWICYGLSCLSFLCLVGSGAKNGMIALFIVLLLIPVVFRRSLKKSWRYLLISYVSYAVIFLLFNIINDGMATENLEKGFTIKKSTDHKLESIETNKDNVVITYNGNQLFCTFHVTEGGDYSLGLKDSNGNDISTEALPSDSEQELDYKITDERFPFIVGLTTLGWFDGFYVNIDDMSWGFTNQTFDEGYYYFTPYQRYTKIDNAETAIFTNYPALASGRGYIWARTIPLLKKYFLLGSGPDTFTLVFPQADYVSAYNSDCLGMIFTKPHNLYLQIGVQTGVISLIAYLCFNLIYLIDSIRLYWKRESSTFMDWVGMGIMLSITGYLISGLVNDSTVTMAPVYWCLMGIGLAVNRINANCLTSDN